MAVGLLGLLLLDPMAGGRQDDFAFEVGNVFFQAVDGVFVHYDYAVGFTGQKISGLLDLRSF